MLKKGFIIFSIIFTILQIINISIDIVNNLGLYLEAEIMLDFIMI